MTSSHERRMLLALLFANFVTGTGILLPAGILPDVASDLHVSVSQAGWLMVASGLTVAAGAPLLAAATSHIGRQALLVAAMLLYALCNLVSVFAPSLSVLIAARVLMAVSAAIVTPQAAATVGALLPPVHRASAITFIFVGWSFSTVAGIPLGSYVASTAGWRLTFALVAALSVLSAAAIFLTVPNGVKIAPLNAHAWKRVAGTPALLVVLLVTILNGTGQFTFFTYLAPFVHDTLQAGAATSTALLAWYGVTATLGNIAVSRVVDELGPARAVLLSLLSMAIGLAVWGAGAEVLWLVIGAAAFWGMGTFATNSVQQARLAAIAPEVTSASISLNTSSIYVGQAMGSALGGILIDYGYMRILPIVGAAILLLSAAASWLAQHFEPPLQEPGQHSSGAAP